MANLGYRELALVRDLNPFDANIENGRVVVFCAPGSTVTFPDGTVRTADNNSVVLPNHAAALPRAFAGIFQGNGKNGNPYVSTNLDLLSDSRIAVQKTWIPCGALKPNTAIQIGDPVGYDPTGAGYLQKHVDGTTVRIGVAQETVSSSAQVQLFMVELTPAAAINSGMISELLAPGANVTNTTTETALAAINVPKQFLLPGRKLRVRGHSDIPTVNAGDKLILSMYFHKSSVSFSGSGSVRFMQTPTAAGGTAVSGSNQSRQDFDIDLQTLIAAVFSGSRALGAIGTATQIMDGLATGPQAVDLSVDNTVTITATWNAANATNVVRQTALSVELV